MRGLLALGPAAIRRASHVEPTPDGRWTADLGPMDGPVLGPFTTRAAALDAEQVWLVHHFASGHPQMRRVIVRSESLASATAIPPDPPEARAPVRVHAYLTALPGLLAEADLAEAHVEGRDRRTGTLVAYSFVTIHRALALHVAEAVRAALARLEIEARPDGSRQEEREASDREGSHADGAAAGHVAPQERDDVPGQYL